MPLPLPIPSHTAAAAPPRLLQALNMTQVQLRAQAVGGRQKLAACGIPEATIRGFRAPQLESKLELRAVLKNNFFLYDRSAVGRCKFGCTAAAIMAGWGRAGWASGRLRKERCMAGC